MRLELTTKATPRLAFSNWTQVSELSPMLEDQLHFGAGGAHGCTIQTALVNGVRRWRVQQLNGRIALCQNLHQLLVVLERNGRQAAGLKE